MATEEHFSLEQLDVLSNPVRLQILTSLRVHGPQSVGDLSSRVSRAEQQLFYHVNLMVKHGLIVPVESRRSTTKPVTVYRAMEPRTVSGFDLDDEGVRTQFKKNTAAILRAAQREFDQAVEAQRNESQETCHVVRATARLDAAGLEELRTRLSDLRTWMAHQEPDEGTGFSFTVVIAPLP